MTEAERRNTVDNPQYNAAVHRLIAAAGKRAGSDINALAGLAALADSVEVALRTAVHQLRNDPDMPASWAQIGQALGISRQAAQERFRGTGLRKPGGQPGEHR